MEDTIKVSFTTNVIDEVEHLKLVTRILQFLSDNKADNVIITCDYEYSDELSNEIISQVEDI